MSSQIIWPAKLRIGRKPWPRESSRLENETLLKSLAAGCTTLGPSGADLFLCRHRPDDCSGQHGKSWGESIVGSLVDDLRIEEKPMPAFDLCLLRFHG